ncbi:probable serine carboxypeptidase CPVL [Ylistrum balloti]|uniref:probable serine carboxypeptidase CPVL n=1 Tax=Ylistrum balloti TaxID=509963 RepID=UPI002905BA64|nr:probable serine carboxypeptidase CPVL [Ylistrum balloti]
MVLMLRSSLVILLVSLVSVSYQSGLRGMFPKSYPPMKRNGVDPGQPLFLSPYLERGEANKAQNLSIVGPLEGTNLKSYSGFITVNRTTTSNIFFWFFPAQEDPLNAPVVMWLQGGPGGSSLFGLFVENGPLMVNQNLKLMERNITWNKKYSMLYVDNPVGTGFSFTSSDAGYAKNEWDVATDLYSFLLQFFKVYYQYQKNDFYATGESYAGKYVPAISYKIHISNPTANLRINFKGMAIGDGLCDPESMMNQYADFMFNIGMLDEKQRDYFAGETEKAVEMIKNRQFREAFQIFDLLLNGDLTPYKPYFYNVTQTNNYYNFLLTEEPADFNYYGDFLAKPEVRKAIHVGNLTYNDGKAVEMHLINDVMDTVKYWVEVILKNNYKVMFYNGQLDIIVAVPLTEAFLMSTDWPGQQKYKEEERLIWKVNPSDQEVAGYVRVVENLQQVIVRDAGHILPYDQPERGFDLIQRFIENKPFH